MGRWILFSGSIDRIDKNKIKQTVFYDFVFIKYGLFLIYGILTETVLCDVLDMNNLYDCLVLFGFVLVRSNIVYY